MSVTLDMFMRFEASPMNSIIYYYISARIMNFTSHPSKILFCREIHWHFFFVNPLLPLAEFRRLNILVKFVLLLLHRVF